MPEVVLVTGISGSGKSVAMNALEDAGYYCVDNLPPELLRDFLAVERTRGIRRVAVAVDVRSTGSPSMLVRLLHTLRAEGILIRPLFLEAATDILVRRFSESRRPHPLNSGRDRNLVEAITLERDMMAELRMVSTVFDTSHLRPAQLRLWLRELLGIPHGRLTLIFESFAFKQGVPLNADFVFDVRVLPNPYYERGLRAQTGKDQGVMEYLERQPEAQEMVHQIAAFLQRWLHRFQDDQRSYLTVAIGCTGGQHRSVYLSEQLRLLFRDQLPTLVRHRELDAHHT
jgi:UPF0042 nucleotide-binding protein